MQDQRNPWGAQTARSSNDEVARTFDSPADEPVVDAVQAIAEARAVPMAQVAIAWLLTKPAVAAPVVGATKPHHLAQAVTALDLGLTDQEIQTLETPYVPQEPYWY
ncbi:aldo/keto reductase [Kribbella antibiotica]|uniref:Aldo/keto reductase n=1 Tax=Kribbella antibiotica TaxID=190195 RepID=A0A4R4ZWY2_9ACTN|nr:aldo/keto reductase [Kribbella antibiotica]TDD63435.1 aldo/keto reductase [Kribbella antibiotica]